jgi:hypothetical protein
MNNICDVLKRKKHLYGSEAIFQICPLIFFLIQFQSNKVCSFLYLIMMSEMIFPLILLLSVGHRAQNFQTNKKEKPVNICKLCLMIL